jgi:predicted  nucleic acid-binding Zn-ribbon protein
MGVAKQLYQLQEVDLELESNEQALRQMTRLDELRHQQHSTEWEIDDIVGKITTAEEQLYSGRIKNPKELTSLQHEVNMLKAKRDQLETRALEIMDQVELTEASVATVSGEFKKLEAEWHDQQQQLSADIEKLKSKLSALGHKRQLLSVEIDPQAIEVYDRLKKQKGQAVAKVEQGICRGCRISLPFSGLQQARSGDLMQCGSCGRILFLP